METIKLVERNCLVRGISDSLIKKRQVEFVISSESVDTYGTVFLMSGWKLDRYKANPVVCYNHKSSDSNPDLVLGTSEVFIENNLLIGRVTFESAEVNPLAERVFNKIKAGTLKMASISAIPSEYRFGDFDKGENPEVLYFVEQELIEWSIVSIGSNPDAHKRNLENISEFKSEIIKDIDVEAEQVLTPKRNIREKRLLINKLEK